MHLVAFASLLFLAAPPAANAPAVAAPAAAPPAPAVKLSGKVEAAEPVAPAVSSERKWNPYLDEKQDRNATRYDTLKKAVDVHVSTRISKGLPQYEKNRTHNRTWRTKALKELRAVADRSPYDEHALALFLWWEAQDQGVEPKEAVQALEEAAVRLKGTPGYSYVRQDLASFLAETGAPGRVRPLLEETLANVTDEEARRTLHQWLGDLARREGRFADADQHFQAVLEKAEQKLTRLLAHYGLLWSSFAAGDCKRATNAIAEIRRLEGQFRNDWHGGAIFGRVRPDTLEIGAACRAAGHGGPPAPSGEAAGEDGEEEISTQGGGNASPQALATDVLSRCYARAARRSPEQATPVLVTASGELKAPVLRVQDAATKKPWPLGEAFAACGREELARSGLELQGTIEGELRIEPRRRE
ncbi:MAG: hypothetical protein HY901_36885 [Deltaproteobacteria bacterium]|nr:hypothetical protein [Deltaproteobacteria bacterium]